MAQEDNSAGQFAFTRPMLFGTGIGLLIISFFVTGVDEPRPEWGSLWMLRPLIVTPLAGAMGGLFYYLMTYLSLTRSFNKTLAIIIGAFGFIIALWLGIVLGLDGTLWD